MAASVQCSNTKLVVWGLVLVILSILSMLVGVVKGAHWPMVVCASVSVLLFLLLFVVVFTKTAAQARPDTADAMEMQKEQHCVWAACKFGELEACTRPVFSLLLVKNDPGPSDSSDLDNIVTWTTLTTVGHRLTGAISCQRACACCLEDYHMDSDVALLPCGHIYHQECIARWCVASGKAASCPTCRTSFDQVSETIMAI
ncbi:Rnf103 [Symbiodinium sp. CCMP2456]|nr:Rnf103 [Symbiodinium sp. CCMP2456]